VGGFTLIEVMIVVAIIGILASIAVPMYSEHIAKGRRSQATVQLLQVLQYTERYYIEKRTYQGADFAKFSPVPLTGTRLYTSSTEQTNVSFYFQLDPVGPMVGDRCGSFRIDNYGRRSVVGYNTSIWPNSTAGQAAARAYCWGSA
jgi:type IV pilus assembly protein PilE